jgi:uncharacterized protein YjbI with pentapeptide repeats
LSGPLINSEKLAHAGSAFVNTPLERTCHVAAHSSVYTALRNTALRNTALRNTALRNTALRNTALRNTALRNTALRNTALRNTRRWDTPGACVIPKQVLGARRGCSLTKR